MHRNIRISLVIPTYNRAALIGETICAALAQSVPFFEIIIVDDGSTDDTLSFLRRFGESITVLSPGKIGLQRARNAGVDASGAEYVAFCDSDDLLEPGFVETTTAWLAAHPDWQSIYVNYRSFTASGIDTQILANAPTGFLQNAVHAGSFIEHVPDLYARTMQFQPLLVSGMLIRRALFISIGGFNAAMNGVASEDWEYTLRVVGAGKTAICAEPLVRIRRHSENQSRDSLRQVLGEIEILRFALKKHPAARKYQKEALLAIQRRRHAVFYEAFRQGRFAYAALVLPFLENEQQSVFFRIKALLVAAYAAIVKPDAKALVGFHISPDEQPHQDLLPAESRPHGP